jgi:hypothetical protein
LRRPSSRPEGAHARTPARSAWLAPTTSLVDEHGHETLRLVGYQPQARLREALEREVQVACADARSPSDALEAMPTCEVGGDLLIGPAVGFRTTVVAQRDRRAQPDDPHLVVPTVVP